MIDEHKPTDKWLAAYEAEQTRSMSLAKELAELKVESEALRKDFSSHLYRCTCWSKA